MYPYNLISYTEFYESTVKIILNNDFAEFDSKFEYFNDVTKYMTDIIEITQDYSPRENNKRLLTIKIIIEIIRANRSQNVFKASSCVII